jgi:hypothetical protein
MHRTVDLSLTLHRPAVRAGRDTRVRLAPPVTRGRDDRGAAGTGLAASSRGASRFTMA